jgi:hypothetical protein
MLACNKVYTALADTLYRRFNGDGQALGDATSLMYEFKYADVRTTTAHRCTLA